jgi:hypothetical protein
MEILEGSVNNRVIGVGTRFDPRTNSTQPVFDTYPSFYEGVVQAFADYPIAKYFGLTYESAMRLPVNEWYYIRDVASSLAVREKKPDPTEQLMKVIEHLLQQQSQQE